MKNPIVSWEGEARAKPGISRLAARREPRPPMDNPKNAARNSLLLVLPTQLVDCGIQHLNIPVERKAVGFGCAADGIEPSGGVGIGIDLANVFCQSGVASEELAVGHRIDI